MEAKLEKKKKLVGCVVEKKHRIMEINQSISWAWWEGQ